MGVLEEVLRRIPGVGDLRTQASKAEAFATREGYPRRGKSRNKAGR